MLFSVHESHIISKESKDIYIHQLVERAGKVVVSALGLPRYKREQLIVHMVYTKTLIEKI